MFRKGFIYPEAVQRYRESAKKPLKKQKYDSYLGTV